MIVTPMSAGIGDKARNSLDKFQRFELYECLSGVGRLGKAVEYPRSIPAQIFARKTRPGAVSYQTFQTFPIPSGDTHLSIEGETTILSGSHFLYCFFIKPAASAKIPQHSLAYANPFARMPHPRYFWNSLSTYFGTGSCEFLHQVL